MAEVIEWDAPLNTEEDIEWENNLTKGIPNTAFQTQNAAAAAAPGPYAAKPPINPQAAQMGLDPFRAASPFPDIDTETGADFGTRQGLGMVPEDALGEQQAYLAARLQQKYKRPVMTRIGPQTGEVEFLSPKTKKWTTANRSGLAAMGVDMGIGIPATVGGTAAGGLTGNPVGAVAGTVAGAAAGSGLSQVAKNAIGKKIGALPENYPVGTDLGSATAQGAAFEAGTMGVLGAAKYARYWFKGSRAFGAAEAAELGAAAAKADKIVAEIEKMSGQQFNPTVGQRVSRADMGPPGADSRKIRQKALGYDAALSKDPNTQNEILALHEGNEDALVNAFDNITDPYLKQSVESGLQQSQEGATEQVVFGLTSGYDELLDAARKMTAQLPEDMPAGEAGKVMRKALVEADRKFKSTVEDPAWAKYRDGTGYNPSTFESDIRVPLSDEVFNLMSKWDSRKRNALLGAIKKDNADLKVVGKEKDGWAAELDWDVDGNPVFKSLERKDDVDLATLDDTIKWLRSDARAALKNKQGVTYNEKDLVDLERAFTANRNEYLQNNRPELFDMLQEAEAATKLRASQFKNSAVGDLLIKDGPDSYRLTDEQALYRIITTSDTTAATQFAELTRGYPEAAQQARQMIYSLYRRAVIDPKTGAPRPASHANFMSDYKGVIDQFFPDKDMLNRMGGMGTAIAREQEQLKVVLPQFKKLFGGEIVSLNSPALSRIVLSDKSPPAKVGLAVNILRRNGQEDLIDEWQHSVLDQLGKNLIKDGQINSNALAKFLSGQQAKSVENLLNSGSIGGGARYIRNLKTIQEALNMVRTQGKGQLDSQANGLLVRLARLFFGQFTPEARVVTFGQKNRTRVVPGEIYKAITDPAELGQLAKQADKTMGQIRKAAVVGKIGEVLADDFNY